MGMLLSFSPFIVFALLSRVAPVTAALFAGAVVAVALVVRERVLHKRSLKILEAGTALLFAGLGVFVWLTAGGWSIVEVRLAVDIGLLAIVLLSMLLRQPFTLQYARERVSAEIAAMPQFLTINYIISGVWALAFVLMVGADFIMVFRPDVPLSVGVKVTIAALVGALWFTGWYPAHLKRKLAGRVAPTP
ncbi:MAG TPA: hypothetical protein VGI11_05050 [Variovorax sp.]